MVGLLRYASFLFYIAIPSFLILTAAAKPLSAQFSSQGNLIAGDLVITEISPEIIVEGFVVNYLELYNASNHPVELEGFNIRVGEEYQTISESFVVEPYEMVLLSSRDLNHPHFLPDLILQGLHLPVIGGFVELLQGDVRVASAAWQGVQEGRSLELIEVRRGLNGFTQAEDYRPSENFFTAEFYGSPGVAGFTRLAYSRTIGESGNWILAGAPGWLPLESEASSWSMKGTLLPRQEPEGSDLLSRGAGILLERPEKPQRLTVSDSDEQIVEIALPENQPWILLGNPWKEPLSLESIHPVDGNLESRAVQVWDSAKETFHLPEPGVTLEPWQAFLLKNRDASAIRFSEKEEEGSQIESSEESRWISFELHGRGIGQEPVTDRAARLLFHKTSFSGSDPLDAEKLWPFFRNERSLRSSLLYFIGGSRNEPRYLAQDARSYEVTEPFEVILGHIAWNMAGSHELKWDLSYNIPEEWELLLTDLQTGVTVNLREEIQLLFEPVADQEIRPPFTENPGIHPFEPSEPFARFVLSVNPEPGKYNAKQTGEQEPERVELYQNYPNPFNGVTTISFFLPEETSVVVNVYNVVGQRVAMLGEGGALEGGRQHELNWDATEMPSGIYIVRLEIGNMVLTRKMTLVK